LTNRFIAVNAPTLRGAQERSAVLSFWLLRVPAGVPERVVSYRETLRLALADGAPEAGG
jgi:hypothetical protein